MYEEMYAPLPDAKAYAERIGLEWPLTPDLDTLDRIILAHQCMVPFENLQCYDQGQEPSLAIETLFEKIVAQRRGGFCFELNALLLSFLKALGYDAWGISCRIVRGRDYAPPMLHRALLVRLEETVYYCDVGYGGPQPAGPVPVDGERVVFGERFLIEPRGEHWWGLDRYTSKGERERVIELLDLPLPESYFIPYNFYCSKNPSSLFAKNRVLNLRTAQGSLALMDATLTEHRGGEVLVTEAGSREELAALIREKFGIDFPAASLRWEEG